MRYTVRDYGDVEVATSFQKKGEQRDFYTVSMKEDFKKIDKEGARPTGLAINR